MRAHSKLARRAPSRRPHKVRIKSAKIELYRSIVGGGPMTRGVTRILLSLTIVGSALALSACSDRPLIFDNRNLLGINKFSSFEATVGQGQGGGPSAMPARVAVTH